ncbi:tryptophan-rich sensory protein [bacterium]|nr:tryptophan-rich sensory protein [bacterium]
MATKTNLSGPAPLATALLAALAFAGVVAVNGLANVLPLNGVSTAALSDEIPNLFVPAGLTFAIWGVIYLLLAGYVAAAIAEARRAAIPAAPGKLPSGRAAWSRYDAILFLVNAAANAGWIFAWHWRLIWVSMALMLIILATLILLEDGNQVKLAAGGPLAADRDVTPSRRFFLTAPLRVYLGWISVATIANATALLVRMGWNGFGLDPRIWTVVVIGVGLLVALDFALGKREIAAPLVIVWAYLGIVVKRVQVDAAYSAPVWIAAALAIAAILAAIAVPRLKRRQT